MEVLVFVVLGFLPCLLVAVAQPVLDLSVHLEADVVEVVRGQLLRFAGLDPPDLLRVRDGGELELVLERLALSLQSMELVFQGFVLLFGMRQLDLVVALDFVEDLEAHAVRV